MTQPLTIQTALTTLGPEHAKDILKQMWLSALSLNAHGRGQRYAKTLCGHTIPSANDHIAEPVLLNTLVERSYDILSQHGFSRPELWQQSLYEETIDTPESTSKEPLTVGDLILELREQRAAQYKKLLETFTLPKGAKVADIGVGSGLNFLRFLEEHPNYKGYGLDTNYDPGVYPIQALEDLPNYTHHQDASLLTDNLDLISIGWIFHHAGNKEDPTKTHKEILDTAFQKLKPGGVLVCSETLPATSINKEAPQVEQLAVAEAYLRDAVSSVGMLPEKPNNHVIITGHEDAEHWHDLIVEAGFLIVEEKTIAPEGDAFGETTVRYTLIKPMDDEEAQRDVIRKLCENRGTITVPFHCDDKTL